jgi:hypothetical protein
MVTTFDPEDSVIPVAPGLVPGVDAAVAMLDPCAKETLSFRAERRSRGAEESLAGRVPRFESR